MEEITNIPVEGKQDLLGTIEIAPEVLEVITGIVTGQVAGVHSMHGGIRSEVTSLLGKVPYRKGVALSCDEHNRLIIDLYLSVTYGASIPKISLEIQKRVREQILYMCDIELDEVNVHVMHVVPVKSEEKTGE